MLKNQLRDWVFKDDNLLGLEIGSTWVKVVELKRRGQQLGLLNYHQITVPRNSPWSELKPQFYAWQHGRIVGPNVAVAMPLRMGTLKEQSVPRALSGGEIRKFVLQQRMLGNASELPKLNNHERVQDYQWNGVSGGKFITSFGDDRSEQLLYGQVPRHEVQLLEWQLAELGWRVVAVEFEILALSRAIRHQLQPLEKPVMVFHCEFDRVLVLVCDWCQLFYWESCHLDWHDPRSLVARLPSKVNQIIVSLKEQQVTIGEVLLLGDLEAIHAMHASLDSIMSSTSIAQDVSPLVIQNGLWPTFTAVDCQSNQLGGIPVHSMMIPFGLALLVKDGY